MVDPKVRFQTSNANLVTSRGEKMVAAGMGSRHILSNVKKIPLDTGAKMQY